MKEINEQEENGYKCYGKIIATRLDKNDTTQHPYLIDKYYNNDTCKETPNKEVETLSDLRGRTRTPEQNKTSELNWIEINNNQYYPIDYLTMFILCDGKINISQLKDCKIGVIRTKGKAYIHNQNKLIPIGDDVYHAIQDKYIHIYWKNVSLTFSKDQEHLIIKDLKTEKEETIPLTSQGRIEHSTQQEIKAVYNETTDPQTHTTNSTTQTNPISEKGDQNPDQNIEAEKQQQERMEEHKGELVNYDRETHLNTFKKLPYTTPMKEVGHLFMIPDVITVNKDGTTTKERRKTGNKLLPDKDTMFRIQKLIPQWINKEDYMKNPYQHKNQLQTVHEEFWYQYLDKNTTIIYYTDRTRDPSRRTNRIGIQIDQKLSPETIYRICNEMGFLQFCLRYQNWDSPYCKLPEFEKTKEVWPGRAQVSQRLTHIIQNPEKYPTPKISPSSS